MEIVVKQSAFYMEDPKLKVLSLDELPEHSFIVLTVDVPGPMEKYQASDSIVGKLNEHKNIFKDRKLTLIVMTTKETIDILTEEEMNQIGWFRKKLS